MQIDPHTVNNTFAVIGGFATVIAAIFSGGLVVKTYQRWTRKRDKNDSIHDSIRVHEIDDQSNFQDRLLKRVENLEAEIKDMRTEQLSQARENERLKTQNEHLEKDNERQQEEITELKTEVKALRQDRRDMEKMITVNMQEIAALKTRLDGKEPIKVVVEGDIHTTDK